MKQCKICQQIFPADDMFCPNDGTTLSEMPNSIQTPPDNYASNEMPTQVISHSSTNPVNPGNDSAKWLYLVVGIMGTIIVGMAIFMFLPKDTNENSVSMEKEAEKEQPAKETSGAKIKGSLLDDNDQPDQPRSYTGDDNTNSATPVATPSLPKISPQGRWSGDWSSSSGAYLTIVVDLNDDGTGKVNGQIEWTLRRTSRPEKMSKIGMSAIEYVSGRYNPATQMVTFSGYRKDDPNGVLVMLDDYRLKLSKDNQHLRGAAKNGGKWNGQVNLSR